MDADKIVEFAPYILVAFMFFWKNNVFVRQEQLERTRREIIEECHKSFVELNAYREFQNHIYSKLDEIIEEIKGGRHA